ncbi:hypothetical protein Tco_0547651 [Tanacetum coccineum]
MASLDHRLNPLFSIKECSSCGALYTADFCCSKGGLEDKILVPKPPQNCATCGDPVDGLYCRPCAFVRKCLNEGWYTIHDENEILNTSESSNDNTNIVSAPQEPFVFNQDPGQNSSQSLPQINHNCCYECGDSLDDIFCQRCTCKSCGKGAHYGYNCPPQIPIISNLEPCYNQNLNEILQNLQSLQQQSFLGTCQQCGCNEYDGVCFHCTVGNGTQINFSTPYSSNDSPNFANHPPQPQYETNICELCGNDAHFGYDCSPQVPFQILKGIQQEKKKTAAQSFTPYWNFSMIDDEEARDNFLKDICTFLRRFSRIPFGVTPKVILIAWERFGKIKDALTDKQYRQEDIQELMSKLLEDVRNISEELSEYINCPSWNHPRFYDNDDDEYTIIYSKLKAITPDLPIEEPDNSLSMGDEHLDTIPSIENLVPIPSEFKGISDDTCDVPVCEDPSTFNALNVHSEILPDPNDDGTSSDDDSYENIEYVEASPLNLEYDSLEEVNEDQKEKEFDLEDIFQIQDVILQEKLVNISRLITNIESLKDNPTPDHVFNSPSSFPILVEPDLGRLISIVISDNSNDPLLEFPEFESFHFDLYDDPSFPRPPPKPPDVEIGLIVETDAPMINNFDELNEDKCFEPGEVRLMLKMMIPSHLSFGLFSRFSLTLRFLLYFPPPGVKTLFFIPASPLKADGISSGWACFWRPNILRFYSNSNDAGYFQDEDDSS